MNPRILPLITVFALVMALGTAACSNGTRSSATVTHSDLDGGNTVIEATLTGPAAATQAAGDSIVLRNGNVFVNNVPYGSISPKAVVTYTIAHNVRTLKVDGEPRTSAR